MSATIADGVVLTVEVGFSTSAGGGTVPLNSTLASITWTDVSAYVRSVSTSRGRSSELDTFKTGSASIVFSNADRLFDPEYSAGPYYGNLTPLRPVRIRAQYGAGATTNLFFGWVEQWPQAYTNPSDATVTVTASDAFKVLNMLTLTSYWEFNTLGLSPYKWYRFDDGDTPAAAYDDIQDVADAPWLDTTGASTTSNSSGSLIVDDSSVSASFDGTKYVSLPQGVLGSSADSTNNTVSFWFSTSTNTTGRYGMLNLALDELTVNCGLVVDGSGAGTIEAQWGFRDGTKYFKAYSTLNVINDGKPHHVVLTWDTGTPANTGVYVDSTFYNTSTTKASKYRAELTLANSFGAPISWQTAGGGGAYDYPNYFEGVVDELAFWNNTTLTSSQIIVLKLIGQGFYGYAQTTDSRISTVLTMSGWMSDGSNLSLGLGTVQGIRTQHKTVLAAAQECEAAEQGKLFIDRDGKLRFIGRKALAETTTYNTSQYTFGDSTGELGYTSLTFEYNDRLIFNRVMVSRSNGATVTVDDATSQGQYFIRTSSLSSLIIGYDVQAKNIADARLANYRQPSMRVENLAFTPRQSPSTLYPVAIGVEIGTRITVKRRPQGVGSVLSKEVLVEGISHSITPGGWETSFSLSPVFAATFLLDSAVYGVLNVNPLGY